MINPIDLSVPATAASIWLGQVQPPSVLDVAGIKVPPGVSALLQIVSRDNSDPRYAVARLIRGQGSDLPGCSPKASELIFERNESGEEKARRCIPE